MQCSFRVLLATAVVATVVLNASARDDFIDSSDTYEKTKNIWVHDAESKRAIAWYLSVHTGWKQYSAVEGGRFIQTFDSSTDKLLKYTYKLKMPFIEKADPTGFHLMYFEIEETNSADGDHEKNLWTIVVDDELSGISSADLEGLFKRHDLGDDQFEVSTLLAAGLAVFALAALFSCVIALTAMYCSRQGKPEAPVGVRESLTDGQSEEYTSPTSGESYRPLQRVV